MQLTIITINKNNLNGLIETTQSVFRQTFTNFEYIVIDGNSTDGSKDYIASIVNKLACAISENDSGVYNAMNKGIREAKGTYLMFLNSGDRFCTNEVLHQVFNENSSAEVIHGNVLAKDKYKNQVIKKTPSFNQLTASYFLYDTIYHQGSFIKKSVFEQYGLYDENYKIISDWVLFLKLAINGGLFEYKNVDIAFFEPGGISSSYPDTIIKEKKQELSKPEYGQLINDFVEISRLKAALPIANEYKVVKSNKVLSKLINAYLRYHYFKKRHKLNRENNN
jgi:glycosyltransferase involved in cell wall biosynthesis